MIKAKLSNGTLVLGLSARNIIKLMQGRPILFDGAELGYQGQIVIMYGLTEAAILQEIQEASSSAKKDEAP